MEIKKEINKSQLSWFAAKLTGINFTWTGDILHTLYQSTKVHNYSILTNLGFEITTKPIGFIPYITGEDEIINKNENKPLYSCFTTKEKAMFYIELLEERMIKMYGPGYEINETNKN